MRRELPSASLLLLLFLTGCATPPLCVVPVATISNDVTLAYAYGEGSPFRLQSAPVKITALVPRASSDATFAAAGRSSADAAAKIESLPAASSSGASHVAATIERHAQRSTVATEHAHAEVRRAEVGAFREDTQAASSTAQTVERERHDASVACASQEDTAGASTIRQQFGEASGETLVQQSFIAATNFAGSEGAESYHSDIGYQFAHAQLDSSSAYASSAWSARQPTIRKWSTLRRVVVGDEFEYVVEIHNSSPIDLVFVEVRDLLDPRLSVVPSAVRTTPYAKVQVHLNDRLLSVRFPHGIGCGQTVKILIPAILKLEVAEQDKSSIRAGTRR